MADIRDIIQSKAKAARKTVVLPEGSDHRIVAGAVAARRDAIADTILVGSDQAVQAAAVKAGVSIADVPVVHLDHDAKYNQYAAEFYELRKHKGVSRDDARAMLCDPVYYATMMVYAGDADGMVSGAIHSTSDTVRPALQILKTAPGIFLVSSCFLMIVPNSEYGESGAFIFADCGLVINPSDQELAEIALTSAATMRTLLGLEPRVAMLCFSTKGSGKNEIADKVIRATQIARQRDPNLLIDGEIQADAALVDWIGERKAPGSPVAGRANVLIFPDLNAGNIAYKLTERLARAEAYGPILQGVRKPVNDLSRGCDAEDVLNVIAITAAQAAV